MYRNNRSYIPAVHESLRKLGFTVIRIEINTDLEGTTSPAPLALQKMIPPHLPPQGRPKGCK